MVFGDESNQISRVNIAFSTSGTDESVRSIKDIIGHIFSVEGAALAAGAALGFLSTKVLANAISAAADFEEVIVEIEKVTNAATTNIGMLSDSLRDLSTEIPVAANDLGEIAAIAGRMGVEGTENILKFTRVVAEMGEATDIAGEDAANGLAKLIAQTDATIDDIRLLGNVINELSNNMAVTTSNIVDAATRSANALSVLGLQKEEILALNATFSETSESATRAGSRMRRFAQELLDPRRIDSLSEAFNITADQLSLIRDEAPLQLMLALAKIFGENRDAAEQLNRIFSTQSQQVLVDLSRNMGRYTEALRIANEESANGNSLAEEAEKAFDTFNSTIQKTRNLIEDIFVEIGNFLLPKVRDLLEGISEGIKSFRDFNESTGGLFGSVLLLSAAILGLTVAFKSALNIFGLGKTTLQNIAKVFSGAILRNIFLLLAGIVLLSTVWKEDFLGIRTITETVGGIILDVLRELDKIIHTVIDTFGELDKRTGGALTKLAKIAITVAGVGLVLKGFTGLLGGAVGGLLKAAGGSKLLTAAVAKLAPRLVGLSGIVGGVASALGISGGLAAVLIGLTVAVVAFGAAYITNFAGIRDKTNETISSINPELLELADNLRKLALVSIALSGPIGLLFVGIATNAFGMRDAVTEAIDESIVQLRGFFRFMTGLSKISLASFRRQWDIHLGEISSQLSQTVDFWITTINDGFDAVENLLARFGVDVELDVAGIVEAVGTAFSKLGPLVKFVFSGIIGIIEFSLDAILTSFEIALALLRLDWKDAFRLFAEFTARNLNGVADFIEQWGGGAFEPIVRGLRIASRTLRTDLASVRQAFVQSLAIVGGVLIAIQDPVTTFRRVWNNNLFDIRGKTVSWASGVVQDFRNAVGQILTLIRIGFNEIVSFITGWTGRFDRATGNAVDAAIDHFERMKRRLIGGSIVPETFDGINSFVESEALPRWKRSMREFAVSGQQAFSGIEASGDINVDRILASMGLEDVSIGPDHLRIDTDAIVRGSSIDRMNRAWQRQTENANVAGQATREAMSAAAGFGSVAADAARNVKSSFDETNDTLRETNELLREGSTFEPPSPTATPVEEQARSTSFRPLLEALKNFDPNETVLGALSRGRVAFDPTISPEGIKTFFRDKVLTGREVEALIGKQLRSRSLRPTIPEDQLDNFIFFDPNRDLSSQLSEGILDTIRRGIAAKQEGIDLLEFARQVRESGGDELNIGTVNINANSPEEGRMAASAFEEEIRARFETQVR